MRVMDAAVEAGVPRFSFISGGGCLPGLAWLAGRPPGRLMGFFVWQDDVGNILRLWRCRVGG